MGGFFGFLRGQTERVRPTQEEGTSGAYAPGGYLVSNERNPKMRGPQRYQEFGNLLANVAIVAAGTRSFLNLLAKSEWTVTPATTDNEPDAARAQDAADLVDKVIRGMDRPWSRVVRRSGMFRFYGFSIQEWTARRNADGTIGMKDVAPRPQSTIERWKLDDAGNVEGVTQMPPGTGREVFLPRGKVIHIVDDALSDSPEGIGLFRHLVDSNYRLQRFQLLEAFGFETDLKGIPVGRAPYAALNADTKLNAAAVTAMTRPLEDFIEDHIKNPELGLVLDSSPYRDEGPNLTPSSTLQWDISLLSGSPTSQAEVGAAIERIIRDMAIVLGVQGLLLGGDGSGSLALGRNFSDQFALMVDSGLGEIAEAYEADLVSVICDLNGVPEELRPTLGTELAQHRSVAEITGALADLAQAGNPLAPDDPAQNAVREMLGIPPVDLKILAEDARLENEAARELALAQAEAAKNPPPPPGAPPVPPGGPEPEPEPPEPES